MSDEDRVWRAWCVATGDSVQPGHQWAARFLVGSTGALAWPVRLHPLMSWLKPPLYDRPSPPETFAVLEWGYEDDPPWGWAGWLAAAADGGEAPNAAVP